MKYFILLLFLCGFILLLFLCGCSEPATYERIGYSELRENFIERRMSDLRERQAFGDAEVGSQTGDSTYALIHSEAKEIYPSNFDYARIHTLGIKRQTIIELEDKLSQEGYEFFDSYLSANYYRKEVKGRE